MNPVHAQLINLENQQMLPINSPQINLGQETLEQSFWAKNLTPRHSRIEFKDNSYYIRDLRSGQPTLVNKTHIIEAQLQDGDIIQMGQLELLFKTGNTKSEKPMVKLSSKNTTWNESLITLDTLSKTEFPVLLLGPSGTGKEILADAIHTNSYRRKGPYVRVNCSALSETLIESELFGHIKGSFTGAIADRKGAFEAARGGTLFLDEIGDLPYGLQAKLLRALENGEIRAVGSDKVIKTDVRIIAATHMLLKKQIQEGQFRADLYYRLNVLQLNPPSLKDRMEDFDDLLFKFSREYRVRFSFYAIEKLKKHNWPGNIRELKNTVARACAHYPGLTVEDTMIDRILDDVGSSGLPYGVTSASGPLKNDLNVIKEIEKQMIVKRLTANNGNQRQTARDLGMPKSTLHDRIRVYNIDLNLFKPQKNEENP